MQSEVRVERSAALLRACRFPSAANRRVSQPNKRARGRVKRGEERRRKERERKRKENRWGLLVGVSESWPSSSSSWYGGLPDTRSLHL